MLSFGAGSGNPAAISRSCPASTDKCDLIDGIYTHSQLVNDLIKKKKSVSL